MKQVGYPLLLLVAMCLVGCSGSADPKDNSPRDQTGVISKTPKKVEREEKFDGPLFFWEVTKADSPEKAAKEAKKGLKTTTHYLLGSPPVVLRNIYPLPPKITNARAKSKHLVAQLDPRNVNPQRLVELLAVEGKAEPGKNLRDYLPKEIDKKWKAFLEKAELPVDEAFSRFQPWSAAFQLMQDRVASKAKPEDLVEWHLLENAEEEGQTIHTLEPPEGPFVAAQKLDTKSQSLLLYHTMLLVDDVQTRFPAVFRAWVAGDHAKFHQLHRGEFEGKYPELGQFYQEYFDKRTARMAEKIEPYLNKKEPTFVVVQGEHFGGKSGLLDLLKSKGYKLKQVHVKKEEK